LLLFVFCFGSHFVLFRRFDFTLGDFFVLVFGLLQLVYCPVGGDPSDAAPLFLFNAGGLVIFILLHLKPLALLF